MKLKKAMILFGTVCILSTMIVGCGSGSESAVKTEENQADEISPKESNDTPLEGVDGSAEETQENTVKILDDGSLSYSSPSSNADLPDTELIHVFFEEDTIFYMRTMDGSGENHEDKEAGFQDLKEHMSVEMKGSFKNDEFHATEIRFF